MLFRRAIRQGTGVADRILQGDVAGGENIRMSGAEHQIHLGGPGADAGKRDQVGVGVVGRGFGEADQVETAVEYGAGDRPQGLDFRARQSAGLQGRVVEAMDRSGIDLLHGGGEARPDGVGAGDRYLLADDDAGEPFEAGRPQAQRKIAGQRQDRAQVGIEGGQGFGAARDVRGAGDSVCVQNPDFLLPGFGPQRYQGIMVHEKSQSPVVRFAPSPNGYLHIGHAHSAIANHNFARRHGGRMLLRIEDIDQTRSRPEFVGRILDDLAWLGLSWEEPVRRQSEHFDDYRRALIRLARRIPLYPARMSRQEIRDFVSRHEHETGAAWPRDPDGSPLYPGLDRPRDGFAPRVNPDPADAAAIRIVMDAAARLAGPLTWTETGLGPCGETGSVTADPHAWGDVVVVRKDSPASYPLAVVVDDALQGVTHVIRGHDLFWATSVQRLLQFFLDLPVPVYCHHLLLLDETGRKLSKSQGSRSIKMLRDRGVTRQDVWEMIGLEPL